MKIKFIITLLLISINLVFSQGNGKIENGTYVCDRFEWKIKIPENYTLSKASELEELERKGNAIIKEDLPAKVELQKRTHLIGFNLDSKNTFSASFNPLKDTQKMTLEQHKNIMTDILKQSCSKIENATFEFASDDIKIGKYQFYKITVKGFTRTDNQLVLTQIYYNSFIKNHLFGALISFSKENEGKLLETNFLNSFN